MSQADKALALVEKAEKKLASWSLFGGNKYEDAAELFIKAANLFKVSKECVLLMCLICDPSPLRALQLL